MLKRYRALLQEAECYSREYREAFERATQVTASLSAERVSGGAPHNKVEEAAILMADIASGWQQKLVEVQAEAAKIRLIIGTIDNNEHRLLLTHRYINGDSWTKTALAMHVSRRTAFRMHRAALDSFGKAWEQMVQDGTP